MTNPSIEESAVTMTERQRTCLLMLVRLPTEELEINRALPTISEGQELRILGLVYLGQVLPELPLNISNLVL